MDPLHGEQPDHAPLGDVKVAGHARALLLLLLRPAALCEAHGLVHDRLDLLDLAPVRGGVARSYFEDALVRPDRRHRPLVLPTQAGHSLLVVPADGIVLLDVLLARLHEQHAAFPADRLPPEGLLAEVEEQLVGLLLLLVRGLARVLPLAVRARRPADLGFAEDRRDGRRGRFVGRCVPRPFR